MNRIPFHKLVDQVSKAMEDSQIALENTALEHFLRYFSSEGEVLEADTKQIKISYFEQGERKDGSFFVPLASLVSHNRMALDKIDLTMHADLHMEEDVLYADLKNEGGGEASDDTSEKSGNYGCEIKLTFKNRQPPDGMKETINMLNKSI